jgi:hypothetical protein
MANWYVDNAASGTNAGTSWTNAWETFADIVWGAGGVVAGDTLYISGGAVTKTYTEMLTVGVSGTAGNLITISVGQDAGHNGVVVIDGGQAINDCIYWSSKNYIAVTGQVGSATGQNIKLTDAIYSGLEIGGNCTGFYLHYIEFPDNGGGDTSGKDGLNIALTTVDDPGGEIDHCIFDNNWTDQIHMTYGNDSQHNTVYGSIKFHHNIIRNTQDDGIETGIGGMDIYDNTFGPRAVWTGRTTGHPDMLQMYGKYYRVYNNTFVGIVNAADGGGNSFIRWEPYSATWKAAGCVRIYNNVFYNTGDSNGGLERGIEISPFGFGADKPTSVEDIVVANNTFYRCWFQAINFSMGSVLGHGDVSGIVFENNLHVDAVNSSTGGDVFSANYGDGTITFGVHGSGADVIVDYNLFFASSGTYDNNIEGPDGTVYNTPALFRAGTSLDSHGLSDDPLLDANYAPQVGSPAIDAGVDLSAYFTTDKDGKVRSAWDIGAYEYGSGGTSPYVRIY